ncbi:hypothetical protein CBOM_07395 [Ceraceosorus bombacis]|uniref:Uncharacterized protein n=1 Tax=Ceraceosorus bombacis TaxID=401625 RepID=A0A0P1B884_9BASI|nr:hypothetical protein CBOM_07395 [Ceraceosorus bombacis]
MFRESFALCPLSSRSTSRYKADDPTFLSLCGPYRDFFNRHCSFASLFHFCSGAPPTCYFDLQVAMRRRASIKGLTHERRAAGKSALHSKCVGLIYTLGAKDRPVCGRYGRQRVVSISDDVACSQPLLATTAALHDHAARAAGVPILATVG